MQINLRFLWIAYSYLYREYHFGSREDGKTRLRIDPLAAHASVTRIRRTLPIRGVRSHIQPADDSRWSSRGFKVHLREWYFIYCGRNNGKNRPGSFSWSQGPRPQVHCRNFPLFYLHSPDVPLKTGIPVFIRSSLPSRCFRTGSDLMNLSTVPYNDVFF